MEAEALLAAMKDMKLPDGRDRLVRHWAPPGARDPDRDRSRRRPPGEEAMLLRSARRTKSLDALLPVLYLRDISTGDFQEALAALLDKDAPNLSPSVLPRRQSLTRQPDEPRPPISTSTTSAIK
jgi:putative transposase